MKITTKWCAAACVLGLIGCGGAQKGAAEPESSPEASGVETGAATPAGQVDVKAYLAREATGLGKITVEGPGKAWTATTSATGEAKVSASDGSIVVEIPIGTVEPVRCQVFGKPIDPAGTIGQVLDAATGKVTWQRMGVAGIEVAQEAPLAFVHAVYLAEAKAGKALGLLKMAVFPPKGSPVLCTHDELGYAKTFEQVSRELVTSLTLTQAAKPAEFAEVKLVTVEGAPIGFVTRTLARDDKERVLTTQSAMFLPVRPDAMRLVDAYEVQAIDAADLIVRGAWVEAENGKLATQLSLQRGAGGKYTYEGLLKGKSVKGDVKVTGKGIPSDLVRAAHLVRETKKTGAFSLVEDEYQPEVDQGKLVPAKYSRTKDDEPGTVRIEQADKKLKGRVDELGMLSRVETEVGGATLVFERAFVRGKL